MVDWFEYEIVKGRSLGKVRIMRRRGLAQWAARVVDAGEAVP